eukprot:CAMPEP_0198222288 /NCGR_PEP_ID=MMETSP1445-20131203/87460_1 /TAXON_ID=36898 /ORGANISM="Pyramimonas sp., Strain CCMP2087" /LENGTH=75 /DNA_ID=CAMNT_0043900733 /DNA_START=140 /DNA_END=368 /DNA_ORIENTATION=+
MYDSHSVIFTLYRAFQVVALVERHYLRGDSCCKIDIGDAPGRSAPAVVDDAASDASQADLIVEDPRVVGPQVLLG